MAALNIQNLQQSTEVVGIAKVRRPEIRMAASNVQYQRMELYNITGEIQAYVWPGNAHGFLNLEDNATVMVQGVTKMLPYAKRLAIDIYDIMPVPQDQDNPIELMPVPEGGALDDIQELISVMDGITSPSLKMFLHDIFSNQDLALTFITGKASFDGHHHQKGGLLRHSLEVVNRIKKIEGLAQHEQEIGIVAALLHDIGKTQESYNNPGRKYLLVKHDVRSLELLAGPLKTLDRNWMSGAELFRACISFPLSRNSLRNVHLPRIIEEVHFADQMSTANYKEKTVYSEMRSGQRCAKEFGETFIRCLPDNYQC